MVYSVENGLRQHTQTLCDLIVIDLLLKFNVTHLMLACRTLAMMTGYGVRSSMLVAHTQNHWLTVVTSSALAVLVLYLIITSLARYTAADINLTLTAMQAGSAAASAKQGTRIPLLSGRHCWPSSATLMTICQVTKS